MVHGQVGATMTTVGIAALWWNHVELLPEFVRLMRVGGWDKLIFVDNASEPVAHAAYQAAVETLGPGASVLRMAENSVLHGWNAGMAALGTDIVVQAANDLVMTDKRWLAWLVAGMAPGIVQGAICFQRGDVKYADGCLCAYWREDWERLGGLDTGYRHPGYWSDVDICWRAERAGLTVRPAPCGIRHLVNVSTGGTPDRESQLRSWANEQRFWDKKQAAEQ